MIEEGLTKRDSYEESKPEKLYEPIDSNRIAYTLAFTTLRTSEPILFIYLKRKLKQL